jgi:hypothetical protein
MVLHEPEPDTKYEPQKHFETLLTSTRNEKSTSPFSSVLEQRLDTTPWVKDRPSAFRTVDRKTSSPELQPQFVIKTNPKEKKRRHRWTKEEDDIIVEAVGKFGKNWDKVAECIENGTVVSGRQCKDHWYHVIVNDKKPWSESEKSILREAVEKHGEDWDEVSREVVTRTAQQCNVQYSKKRKLSDEEDEEGQQTKRVKY